MELQLAAKHGPSEPLRPTHVHQFIRPSVTLTNVLLSSLSPQERLQAANSEEREDSPSAADDMVRRPSPHQHLLERAGRMEGGHGGCRDAVADDDVSRVIPQELEPQGRLPKGERAAARRTRCARSN